MNVIFDLDQTLIDSSAAEALRRDRKWRSVYRLIPQLKPYPGINDLLIELHESAMKIGIVTSSPESYCHRIIRHWDWPIDATTCYHDTQVHKPNTAPILEGLRRLGATPNETFSVGDSDKDIIASKGSEVFAVAALWGTSNADGLLAVRPDALCNTVSELRELLMGHLTS